MRYRRTRRGTVSRHPLYSAVVHVRSTASGCPACHTADTHWSQRTTNDGLDRGHEEALQAGRHDLLTPFEAKGAEQRHQYEDSNVCGLVINLQLPS